MKIFSKTGGDMTQSLESKGSKEITIVETGTGTVYFTP